MHWLTWQINEKILKSPQYWELLSLLDSFVSFASKVTGKIDFFGITCKQLSKPQQYFKFSTLWRETKLTKTGSKMYWNRKITNISRYIVAWALRWVYVLRNRKNYSYIENKFWSIANKFNTDFSSFFLVKLTKRNVAKSVTLITKITIIMRKKKQTLIC